MSIRGRIVIECDSPKCHAEVVIESEDMAPERSARGTGVNVIGYADGWIVDEDGELWCEACCNEERERPEPERSDLWILGGGQ